MELERDSWYLEFVLPRAKRSTLLRNKNNGGSEVKGKLKDKEIEKSLGELAKQVALVTEAIKKDPSKRKQLLIGYISNCYEAVKETLKKQGSVIPHYVILADRPDFGGPSVTDEVLSKAKELKAEAVVSVEGFQASDDISDVIYHVSMSAPGMGVLGWVFKAKLGDGKVDIIREMPYLFDSEDKVKTLEELVTELEEGARK
jgi:hypothetical protein